MPRGVVLIIGAWNYPFQLVLLPLIGAIAAGNCAVVKPSEVSEEVFKWMVKVLAPRLDPQRIIFVSGGVKETTELLSQKWDYIFYTGNGTVGKIVMEAAAKNLTPLTLELGGKCPVIIDDLSSDGGMFMPGPCSGVEEGKVFGISFRPSLTSNPISCVDSCLNTCVKRIVMGKFLNMGQTCVAPDYVILPSSLERSFINALQHVLLQFYGADTKQSEHLSRIINQKQYERLALLLKSASQDANIVIGGKDDINDLWIEPTIVKVLLPHQVSPMKKSTERRKSSLHPLLTQEIFGPILPYVTYNDPSEIVPLVNRISEQPLALYVFSTRKVFLHAIVPHTRSGAVSINECVSHASFRDLPFGGTGSSGFGQYYGKRTFKLFSHHLPVLKRTLSTPDPSIRYPPYSKNDLKTIYRLQPLSLPAKLTPIISKVSDKILPRAKL